MAQTLRNLIPEGEPVIDPERNAEIESFLAGAGWGDAQRLPLAGDASTRRYERLVRESGSAILMDAAPRAESAPCPPSASAPERRAMGWNAMSRLAASRVEAFVAVADLLKRHGLSAPNIFAADAQRGIALIEDLGENLFARSLAQGGDELELYAEAAGALAEIHAIAAPRVLSAQTGDWPLMDYDALALEVNAGLFVEWLPKLLPDMRIDDVQRARWEGLRDGLISDLETRGKVLTLRDYHAENLLWLPERAGRARIGLLDFQDAVFAWRSWDLSMLIHDARRDVSPDAQTLAFDTYVAQSGVERAGLAREFALIGALNSMRILGLFARLAVRDKKPRYQDFMPRMWGHLQGALEHPAAQDLKAFVSETAGAYLR